MNKRAIFFALSAAAVATAAAFGFRTGDNSTHAADAATSPFIVKTMAKTDSRPIAARGPMRARALDVPFIEDFSDPETLTDWGIQDVNRDGNSWEYKSNFQNVICYFGSNGNDDWLVTPAINLGKDDVYTLTFSVGSQGSRYAPEHLTVTMGTSEYATRHTTVLYDNDNIQCFWNGSMETVTITLPVEEDGAYYFGFHCSTPKSSNYALYLDDVKVEQNGSLAAPEAVGSLGVTAGAKGAPTATLSFTAPTLAADGSALKNLDKIEIFRDEQLAGSIDAPAPGSAQTFTDRSVPSGNHTYKVVAYAGGLEGAKAEATVYVGIDTPAPVASVVAKEQGSGVALSWTAPEGVNGGYTGDALSYDIVRYAGSDEARVATGLKVCSFVDNTVDQSTQEHVAYAVTARTSAGTAAATESNSVFVGPAYSLPFYENFEYCNLDSYPWVMEYINSGIMSSRWQLTPMGAAPVCPPIDGDDGMLEFVGRLSGLNFYAGNIIRLATPVLDLSKANNPYVEFYLFHYDTTEYTQEYDEETGDYVTTTTSYNDKLHIQVSVDNGAYTDVPGSDIYLAANNKGWTLYRIPLTSCKGAGKVSVALVGTCDGGANICVDHLTVADTYAADLQVTGLLGPQRLKAGVPASYVVNIVNNGTSSTKNYSVGLYLEGRKVASMANQGAGIFANGGEKTFRLQFTPATEDCGEGLSLTAQIDFPDDECPANNSSKPLALDIVGNILPAVSTIDGQGDDTGVTLVWNEPVIEEAMMSITDDMESYPTFAISGIGSYVLVDQDKASTYTISGINSYENAGAAMAWQVFDARKAGVDTELNFNRRWICHSGTQSLVCWGADASEATNNNDWLISPELVGQSHEVSFMIKSVTLAYPERFRVYYSTGSTDPSKFIRLADANYLTPTSYWRKFSITLPEGAKRFAIQCVSADAFGLMVDDISYTPANADIRSFDLQGYNVYRNGVKINEQPVEATTYRDEPGAGMHSYRVTCQYPDGESALSPEYVYGTTGLISGIEGSDFHAWGNCGSLRLIGCDGEVNVYAIDGRCVLKADIIGNATLGMNPGLYIVTHAGETRKVQVR